MKAFTNLLKPIVNNQYYYRRLNYEQQKIYECISVGIKALAKEIKLPKRPINEISIIFESVLLDNPLFFYVATFNLATDLYKGKCIIRPYYKYSKQFIRDTTLSIKEYLRVYDKYKSVSDIEKELIVHDLCVNTFKYDYLFEDYSFSILGPIINRKATCEGIAKFVKRSLDYLAVDNIIVLGKAIDPSDGSKPERHAWNMVFIEGESYHLDVTFDMTIMVRANRYDYFNLSDNDIKKEHTIINSIPACPKQGNDYYTLNSMVVKNPQDLGTYIANQLKKGIKNIVVKLQDVKDTDSIVDKVIDIAQSQFEVINKKSSNISCSYNPSQLVFEIYFR